MSTRSVSHDECPNCLQRFEILLVKFKLAGVQMILACPNCALMCDEPEASVGIREIFEQAPSIQPQQLEPG
jgi:hypothetical protein